jgi:hypothetical protein
MASQASRPVMILYTVDGSLFVCVAERAITTVLQTAKARASAIQPLASCNQRLGLG